MSIFICEKCGKLDNTACGNNYWHARMNQYRQREGKEFATSFKAQYKYFETHVCCSDCCNGIEYSDGSGKIEHRSVDIENKDHWSKFGKEKLLKWEKRKDGSMENATEYFESLINKNIPLDTIENSAYLHSCKCPVCETLLTRGYDEEYTYCKTCGQRLHMPPFTEEETSEALFEHEMDDYED